MFSSEIYLILILFQTCFCLSLTRTHILIPCRTIIYLLTLTRLPNLLHRRPMSYLNTMSKSNPISLPCRTIAYLNKQVEDPTRVPRSISYGFTWSVLTPRTWSTHSLTTIASKFVHPKQFRSFSTETFPEMMGVFWVIHKTCFML